MVDIKLWIQAKRNFSIILGSFPKRLRVNLIYGQDAQYIMNAPSYIDNGDGTIADQVTGLMWQKAYKVMTNEEAVERIKTFHLANNRKKII